LSPTASFVDDEDVVLAGRRDGELEARRHAGRVRAHRQLDELADAGEVDDLVVLGLDLVDREAQRETAEDDVALAGQVAEECGADAEHARA
jgi:hypothetical protein